MTFRESLAKPVAGIPVALLLFAALAAGVWMFYSANRADDGVRVAVALVVMTVPLVLTPGLFVVNPNEGKVLTLFGTYKGTAKEPGRRPCSPPNASVSSTKSAKRSWSATCWWCCAPTAR